MNGKTNGDMIENKTCNNYELRRITLKIIASADVTSPFFVHASGLQICIRYTFIEDDQLDVVESVYIFPVESFALQSGSNYGIL